MKHKRGKSREPRESDPRKSTSISTSVYVLMANDDESRCKVGHTSMSCGDLRDRYVTSLPTLKICLFVCVDNAAKVERHILELFAANRQKNDKGRLSEWINMNVHAVVRKVSQILATTLRTACDTDGDTLTPNYETDGDSLTSSGETDDDFGEGTSP